MVNQIECIVHRSYGYKNQRMSKPSYTNALSRYPVVSLPLWANFDIKCSWEGDIRSAMSGVCMSYEDTMTLRQIISGRGFSNHDPGATANFPRLSLECEIRSRQWILTSNIIEHPAHRMSRITLFLYKTREFRNMYSCVQAEECSHSCATARCWRSTCQLPPANSSWIRDQSLTTNARVPESAPKLISARFSCIREVYVCLLFKPKIHSETKGSMNLRGT